MEWVTVRLKTSVWCRYVKIMIPQGKTMTCFKFALQLMNLPVDHEWEWSPRLEQPKPWELSKPHPAKSDHYLFKGNFSRLGAKSINNISKREMSNHLLACATPCVRHECFLNVPVVNIRKWILWHINSLFVDLVEQVKHHWHCVKHNLQCVQFLP